MAARTGTELGMFPPQAFWECVLVSIQRYEYTQDRLRKRISDLETEIELLKSEYEKKSSAAMVSEIMLCLIVFVIGYAAGSLL